VTAMSMSLTMQQIGHCLFSKSGFGFEAMAKLFGIVVADGNVGVLLHPHTFKFAKIRKKYGKSRPNIFLKNFVNSFINVTD